MTLEKLWFAFCEKNPHWLTTGAELTPAGLEKLVSEVWKHADNAGYDRGVRLGARAAIQADEIMFEDHPVTGRFKSELG